METCFTKWLVISKTESIGKPTVKIFYSVHSLPNVFIAQWSPAFVADKTANVPVTVQRQIGLFAFNGFLATGTS